MYRRLGQWVVASVALSSAPLFAPDMWIEPATFSPVLGQTVGVRLRVGQDLLGDPLPRDPSLINQFVFEDAVGRKPVVGRDGADPAADKFNQYLKEEGLDTIAALRARRNETGARAHELFSRCAKSLVLSGLPSEAQGDRLLGFTLELLAERNPSAVRAGGHLPVRLMYENRPLAKKPARDVWK